MIYFKSALVGLLTAIVGIIVVILAALRVEYGDGSGAAFAATTSLHLLLGGLTGFALGFWLTLRRGRVRAPIRNA